MRLFFRTTGVNIYVCISEFSMLNRSFLNCKRCTTLRLTTSLIHYDVQRLMQNLRTLPVNLREVTSPGQDMLHALQPNSTPTNFSQIFHTFFFHYNSWLLNIMRSYSKFFIARLSCSFFSLSMFSSWFQLIKLGKVLPKELPKVIISLHECACSDISNSTSCTI